MKRVIAGLEEVTIEPARRVRGEGFEWDHEIQVALPPSYSRTSQSYPVLWVTDGPWYFELAVKAVNFDLKLHLPEMIVVGVGPPTDEIADIAFRRSYEFFPSPRWGFEGFGGELFDQQFAILQAQRQVAGQPSLGGGGAAQFLTFLINELRLALAREYRMTADHTLFGDSGGACFCAYALFARPEAFNRYICGSPDLHADDLEIFRMEERFAKSHQDLEASVFFGAGEAELLDPAELVPAWGVVSSMARMVEILRLRKYPSLRLHARIFPGEDHASVAPMNLSCGLRAVWQGDVVRREHG